MAKITDPDFIKYYANGTGEVVITPSQLYISLQKTGNLTDDGVTLQCVYSFLKEQWRTDSTLIKYPFPLTAVTAEQFEISNGWDFSGQLTRNLIRDAGWAKKNAAGVSAEEYMNLTTLGSFVSTGDKAYYQQAATLTGTPAVYPSTINQAIQIYSSGAPAFDYRSYFKMFLREQGKTYDFYDLPTAQGISSLTYRKYALPLANLTDLKIASTATDAFIATGSPYTGITVMYYSSGVPRTIGSSTYLFNKVISGYSADKQNIYEKVQYLLRQNVDIDANTGIQTGRITSELLNFVGDTLITKSGVFIDNIKSTDINSITFTDISGVTRNYPYTAAGSITFNSNLQTDPSAKYWMYYTTNPAGNFGSSTAVIVQDNNSANITGLVNSQTSVAFTYAYDSNVQGGRTAATDASVTVVALGLSGAQYTSTDSTIARSTTNAVSMVSSLERNYQNS
jgi:hypothetical protein